MRYINLALSATIILSSAGWSHFTAEDYVSEFKLQTEPLAGSDWAHIVYLITGQPD